MPDPDIEETEDACTLTWAYWGIHALLSRFHESRTKDLTAEVKIKNGTGRIVTQGRLNLLSPRSRQEWVSRCAKLQTGPDWDTILEWITTRGLQYYRHHEPIIALSGEYDARPIPWRLNPLVAEEEPTILFGPGGSGKSYLALLGAMLVQRGSQWADLAGVQGHALYLDWESSESRLQARTARLTRGVSFQGASHVQYRHCLLPLADDLTAIKQAIRDYQISLLVVDSLGLAAGGDLVSPDVAIRFFRALRQCHCASLIIAHVAKHAEEKTVYGSVFFHNLARSVWEVIKAQETDDGSLTLSLQHRKANEDRLRDPLGFRFLFSEQAISCESVSVETVPEFQTQAPLKIQIENWLLEGPKTAKQVSECMGKPVITIRSVLNRHRGRLWDASDEKEPRWQLLRPA